MGKKDKKKVIDRLAKKRGERSVESRLKHKKLPKVSKNALSKEHREAANRLMSESARLLSAPEFSELHFNADRLTRFLEEVKEGGIETPEEFVRQGLPRVVDEEFLADAKFALSHFIPAHDEEDSGSSLAASLILGLIEKARHFPAIPFFVGLFVREVKNHPLGDDPMIWKLLSAFFEPRIVKPDQESESTDRKDALKKSEKYPHLVLPSGYSEEGEP